MYAAERDQRSKPATRRHVVVELFASSRAETDRAEGRSFNSDTQITLNCGPTPNYGLDLICNEIIPESPYLESPKSAQERYQTLA
jgi:hypothetical protein